MNKLLRYALEALLDRYGPREVFETLINIPPVVKLLQEVGLFHFVDPVDTGRGSTTFHQWDIRVGISGFSWNLPKGWKIEEP